VNSSWRMVHRTSSLGVSLLVPCALYLLLFLTSCSIYKFKDASIPPDLKTVKINLIENRARLINPQLSPKLTDKLRQKFNSQSKVSQTNNDNADWEINGEIRDYSVSTSGISNQQAASNRLSVSVHITVYKRKDDKTEEYDVSRNFEFSANLSLQQAEASLTEEMIRSLTDDIFNRLFSQW
jgi:hypothetical protein